MFRSTFFLGRVRARPFSFLLAQRSAATLAWHYAALLDPSLDVLALVQNPAIYFVERGTFVAVTPSAQRLFFRLQNFGGLLFC